MHKQFALGLEPPQNLLFIAQSISPSCVKFAQFIQHSIKVHHSRSTDFLQRKFSQKLSQTFKYTKTISSKLACGRRFERKQWAFKCYSCLYSKSGIFCIECFNKGNHEGHNYEKVFDTGGYCDCGDSEMIKQQGHCKQHQLVLSQIQIDKIQTQLFIKQMQFVFYILSVLENKNQLSNSMSFLVAISNSLIKFLIAFNQSSLTSNLMTIELLKSKMYLELTIIQVDIQTVYEYIFRFDYLKQYSQLINDLYIPLNLIYEFKIFKILQRIKVVKKNCRILISPINKHIRSLFRMQKVMNGVFDSSSNSLPYEILQISTDLSLKNKLKIFQKYYNDLRMIANLKEGLNQKYIKHHFINGDITNLSVYEHWVWENYQDFVDKNYKIQLEYLLFITEFIREVKSDKQILIKLMKELITYLKMHKEKYKYVSLFNPKPRTLLLLIHAYFQGNISQAANQDFLELINMTGQILQRMIQSVLNTIRFNALIFTNVSVGNRYVSYMQSVLGSHSRLISSIDLELAKFCMLSARFLLPQNQQHAELKLHYEKLTEYQQAKVKVESLMQMPLNNAKQFLNSKRESDKHVAFDRQKSFNYLSYYINFLRNALVLQHHNFTIDSYLDIRSQQQIINFCGSFVKRFDSINFQLFKQICFVLFNSQKSAQLDFFVNTCADIENKKIKLKSEYKNKFEPICLSFLKMNRYCQWFQVLISGYQVNMIQMVQYKPSQINSLQENSLIFTQKFLSELIRTAKQYSILIQSSTKVFHEDFGTYENFIIELLGVYFTTYCIQIQIFLISLQQFEKIVNSLSKPLKQQIGKLFLNATHKQKKEQKSIQQNKQKMKLLKQKKLQKFKKKQSEVSEKLMKQISPQMQTEQLQNQKCIVCSLDKKGEGLLLLCHIEQSTLFSKLYLKQPELLYSFTSCQHLVHASCIKFLVCQYCKFQANCVVNLNDQNQYEIRQEPQEQINQEGKLNIFDNIQFIFGVNTHRSQIYVKLARSLATAVLYAATVDYNFFLTHQFLISCAILQDLIRKKILFEQEIMSLLKSGSSIEKQHLAYQSAYQYLLEKFLQTKGSQERLKLIKSHIPQQLLSSIEAIFSYIIKSIQYTQISAPHIQTNSLPALLQLPQSIAELSAQIGLCPNCSQHTNQIALCVICKFRTCLGCTGINLTYHMLKQHGDSCIYIRADNGMPLYLGKSGEGDERKVNMKEYLNSVYVNSKGQFYTAKLDFERRSEFYLDNQAYNAVKIDLIRQRICQIRVAGGIRKSNKQVEYKQP